MNRVLYYICRVMNWVLPIVLLWFGNEAIYKATDGSLEKTMYQINMFGAVDFSVSLAFFCTFLLFWINALLPWSKNVQEKCPSRYKNLNSLIKVQIYEIASKMAVSFLFSTHE